MFIGYKLAETISAKKMVNREKAVGSEAKQRKKIVSIIKSDEYPTSEYTDKKVSNILEVVCFKISYSLSLIA
jgi:hypothetical protein